MSIPGPPPLPWNYGPPPVPVASGNRGGAIAILVAVAMALTALVLSIVSLTTRPASGHQPPAAVVARDTTKTDRELCNAVAPLLAEYDKINNAYAALGVSGTPERDAATPKFRDDSLDWSLRMQPFIDQHPDADPFLLRTLQRSVDDVHLIGLSITTGKLTNHATAAINDAAASYAGPIQRCEEVGVTW